MRSAIGAARRAAAVAMSAQVEGRLGAVSSKLEESARGSLVVGPRIAARMLSVERQQVETTMAEQKRAYDDLLRKAHNAFRQANLELMDQCLYAVAAKLVELNPDISQVGNKLDGVRYGEDDSLYQAFSKNVINKFIILVSKTNLDLNRQEAIEALRGHIMLAYHGDEFSEFLNRHLATILHEQEGNKPLKSTLKDLYKLAKGCDSDIALNKFNQFLNAVNQHLETGVTLADLDSALQQDDASRVEFTSAAFGRKGVFGADRRYWAPITNGGQDEGLIEVRSDELTIRFPAGCDGSFEGAMVVRLREEQQDEAAIAVGSDEFFDVRYPAGRTGSFADAVVTRLHGDQQEEGVKR